MEARGALGRRQRDFDASLFGSLLLHEAWGRVPAGPRDTRVAAAPAFAPRRAVRTALTAQGIAAMMTASRFHAIYSPYVGPRPHAA